ncbi:MAG: nucleotide exchange factor GrpE [Angelakisella sp.]|nr:nucleotide exchange factor GrpE [Angelakisella sp.]
MSSKQNKDAQNQNPEEVLEKDQVLENETTPEEKELPAGENEATENTVEADQTAKLQQELADANDRYVRLVAEYDNYRKRTAREKDSIYPDAVANTLKEILPVLDNFERALEAPCSDEEFKKGMTMIHEGLVSVLTRLGVEPIGVVGEEFDPNRHNAVMHVDDESLGKNVVAQIFQKGYRIGDKILRYAMVQQAN